MESIGTALMAELYQRESPDFDLFFSGRPDFLLCGFDGPDTVKSEKVTFDSDRWDIAVQKLGGVAQFRFLILGLALLVAVERLQTAVGAAIAVDHQQQTVGAVQLHRSSHLRECKVARRLIGRRGENLSPSGDFLWIGQPDAAFFQEFARRKFEARVVAGNDTGIGAIFLRRRVEMEDLLHGFIPLGAF
jgi:hypothetical protein